MWWVIAAIIVIGMPFYAYIISKCWAAGKLSIFHELLNKQEEPYGEEEKRQK